MAQDGVWLTREQLAVIHRALRLSVEGNVADAADTPEAALDAGIDEILDAQEAAWRTINEAVEAQGSDPTRPTTTGDRAGGATHPMSPLASRQVSERRRSQH